MVAIYDQSRPTHVSEWKWVLLFSFAAIEYVSRNSWMLILFKNSIPVIGCHKFWLHLNTYSFCGAKRAWANFCYEYFFFFLAFENVFFLAVIKRLHFDCAMFSFSETLVSFKFNRIRELQQHCHFLLKQQITNTKFFRFFLLGVCCCRA